MKKYLVLSVVLLCIAAIAFAALRSTRQKDSTKTEKKQEMKKKKECRHVCPYFS